MTTLKMPKLIKFLVICISIGTTVAYENAYDLLERRNRRIYEPRYLHSTVFRDRNHFFAENPNLFSGHVNPRFSAFGNGYDNLGNGIPVGRSRPFFQQLNQNWRFEGRPFRERTFNDYSFRDYIQPREPFGNYRSESYVVPPFRRNYLTSYGPNGGEYRKGSVDRFEEENEGKNQKKNDEVYQRTQEEANMDTVKKEKSGEEIHSDQLGENKSSVRSNKIVKKGKTTKGFAVHHHKDETGNSTTFFDETSDFGGQSDLRDIIDGFGTRKTLEQTVHKGDEKHFEESGGQAGNYGTGLHVGNRKFSKDFSSMGSQEEPERSENNNFSPMRKTYRYLNGNPFEYTEPDVDNYY